MLTLKLQSTATADMMGQASDPMQWFKRKESESPRRLSRKLLEAKAEVAKAHGKSHKATQCKDGFSKQPVGQYIFFKQSFFLNLAVPCSMWDLSSLTRN